jgi:hypothetical protein
MNGIDQEVHGGDPPMKPRNMGDFFDGDSVEARNKRGRKAGAIAVRAAKQQGHSIINNGAGTMPLDAAAPFGGARYTLLISQNTSTDSSRCEPPHDGTRDAAGKLQFEGYDAFRPALTPYECIQLGIFGGCYFNPKGGKPGIFGRNIAINHKEFPSAWFEDLDNSMYESRRYNIPTNKYKVKSGQNQAFWESKGWIHEQDPRGWFQWYCRFYQGRRSSDDDRQIKVHSPFKTFEAIFNFIKT